MFTGIIGSFLYPAILLVYFHMSFRRFAFSKETLCCHLSQWSHDACCSTQFSAQGGAQITEACSSPGSTTLHLHPAISNGRCDVNFLDSTVLLKLKKSREKNRE